MVTSLLLQARRTLNIAFVAFFSWAVLAQAASGLTTYTVTDTTDTISSSGANCAADGSGDAGEGNCTLRIAAYLASRDGDDSEIILSSGTFQLTSLYDGSFMTDDIQWGDIDLAADGALTIEGAGRNATTIDANAVAERAFTVQPGADVTFSRLAITGGNESSAEGGAILVEGTVTMQNVLLDTNAAASGGALALTQSTSVATLATVYMQNNTASSGSGGGVYVGNPSASIEMRNTAVTNNSAALAGGGVYAADGSLQVTKSEFTGNAAVMQGGGIYVTGATADADFENVTIGENQSGTHGGGLYLDTDPTNTTTIIATTLYGNESGVSATGSGGAIRANDSGVYVQQSIISDNTANGVADQDCSETTSGLIQSLDYNIDGGTTCNFAQSNDQSATNPQLLTLAGNGGSSDTYAFDVSIGYGFLTAVDAIPAADCAVSTDQRGAARPDAGGGACDIGAYEVQDEDRDQEEIDGYGGTDLCDTVAQVFAPIAYYLDDDGDGYYDQNTTYDFCVAPTAQYAAVSSVSSDHDCDDAETSTNPGAGETPYDGVDNDCDASTVDDDVDGDGFTSTVTGGTDCFDDGSTTTDDGVVVQASDIYPGQNDAPYDGVDTDCGGEDDYDVDGDGYQAEGEITGGDDCNDMLGDATRDGAAVLPEDINPGATETWYDNVDQNCDGASDHDQDGDGEDLANWDFDGDGVEDGGTDCVDAGTETRTDGNLIPAERINTVATEDWYDGVDQNCDGASDYDQDGDGDNANDQDSNGDGMIDATDGTDCLDTDATVNPAATDTWYDGVDSDCAGNSDYDQDGDGFDSAAEIAEGTDCDDTDATLAYELFEDEDGDGLGNPSVTMCSATATLGGYVNNADDNSIRDTDNDGYTAADDCDDANADVNPGEGEVPYDGVDNDCDATTADDDLDQDGFNRANDADDFNATVYPDAPEIADGVDNDGDGLIDEGTDNVDDDGDGLSENDGDCDDADSAIGRTTTAYIDADGDGDGAGQAIVLCVADLPSGFSLNNSDNDDAQSDSGSGNGTGNATVTDPVVDTTVNEEGQIVVIYESGEERIIETPANVNFTNQTLRTSTDGERLIALSNDGRTVYVYSAATGEALDSVRVRRKAQRYSKIKVVDFYRNSDSMDEIIVTTKYKKKKRQKTKVTLITLADTTDQLQKRGTKKVKLQPTKKRPQYRITKKKKQIRLKKGGKTIVRLKVTSAHKLKKIKK